MSDDPFERYLAAQEAGLRAEAGAAIRDLVASLPNDGAREAWLRANLHRCPPLGNGCIRHEIFHRIALPVLVPKWRTGDAWAKLTLARHWLNWSGRTGTALDETTRRSMWREALAADPENVGARRGLADDIAGGLHYAFHEWPAGLLIGSDESAGEAFGDIEDQFAELSDLDDTGDHAKNILHWRAFLSEARSRNPA